MSFSPVVPLGGYAGWTFLKRTLPAQQAAFAAAPDLKRDEDYFRANIGKVKTAEALVSDRRLLRVALGAFGLDADINNRFFIRKVLEEGTLKDGTLANRLADKQYRALSAGFGFGDFKTPNTQLSDFADKTLRAYEVRQFEVAVGRQSEPMRLALNAEREVAALARRNAGEDTKWFSIMGSAPLRKVFQTALGLPPSFAAIDLDQQLGVLKSRAEAVFGKNSVSQFSDPRALEGLVRRFLLLSDQSGSGTATAPGSSALELLRASGRGGASTLFRLL